MLAFIRFHFYKFNLPINKKIEYKYFFPLYNNERNDSLYVLGK